MTKLAVVVLSKEAARLNLSLEVVKTDSSTSNVVCIHFTVNGGNSVMVLHKSDDESRMQEEANTAIHEALNNRV